MLAEKFPFLNGTHHAARRRLWILLFISAAVLIALLATGWNIVLFENYLKMLELARELSAKRNEIAVPWLSLISGTVGFLIALAIVIVFFIRLLQEMRLNQLQTEFLTAVTHELKTPIATLELTSSLLREPGNSEDEIGRLWTAHELELRRLREDVESLLEAARMQMDQSPQALMTTFAHSTKVTLDSWVESAMERWRTALGPGARIIREGEALPTGLSLDLKSLDLVVNTLFDNARKFARGAPDITIRTCRLPGNRLWGKPKWRIEIQDRGWGFDPRDRRRIFERFVRSKSSAPYAIPGTGLGLHLARSACRSLGIRLTGRSEGPGKGAVFVLEGDCKGVSAT